MWANKKKRKTRRANQDGQTFSRESEAELTHRACTLKELSARNQLVERYTGLVKRMALNYTRYRVSSEDLEQEGCLGLMRATESFDPSRKLLFGTYAAYWVRAYMQKYLAGELSQRYAAPRSTAFWPRRKDAPQRKKPLLHVVSLDAPRPDSEEPTLGDQLPSPAQATDEQVVSLQLRKRVRSALRRAIRDMGDPRAMVLLERRLLNESPETLAKVGRELSLSREGARLLENRLLGRVEEALAV